MNNFDAKGMQQVCIIVCELLKQRLSNKNHASIIKSLNFCKDDSIQIQFKTKRKLHSVFFHFDIKSKKGIVFAGRYKIVDPTLTTSEILQVVWEDILFNIYKMYGVEITT